MLAHCFVFHRDVRRVGWVPMQVQSTTKRTRIQHNYADTTVQGYPPLTGRVVDRYLAASSLAWRMSLSRPLVSARSLSAVRFWICSFSNAMLSYQTGDSVVQV